MSESKNSMAERPDLDWSQVRETVRMLSLAVAQIDMALSQSDDSIGALTNSFTEMVQQTKNIEEASTSITGDENAEAVVEIQQMCGLVTSNVHHSIVAFQFYDKLTQRLDHVMHALNALSDLVADQSKLYNPNEWIGLQGVIRGRYSMAEEQAMFDALLSGASVEEALEVCRERLNQITSSEDDIELF
jgi:hypothetical protein